jgi:hypothetical protein
LTKLTISVFFLHVLLILILLKTSKLLSTGFHDFTGGKNPCPSHEPLRCRWRHQSTTCEYVSFTPLRHSSPSFRSRQACSNSNPSQKIRVGQRCVPLGTPTHQLPCASQVSEPVYSHACQTPWSVFQDGSDGEPADCCSAVSQRTRLVARNNQLHQRWLPGAHMSPVLWPSVQPTTDRTTSRAADQHKPFRIRLGHIVGPHPLPSRQFQALFDSLFKFLFIFPSRYLFAIDLSAIFSLGRSLPPNLGCIPKQPDSLTAPRGETGSELDGALTLRGDPFQGIGHRRVLFPATDYHTTDCGNALKMENCLVYNNIRTRQLF